MTIISTINIEERRNNEEPYGGCRVVDGVGGKRATSEPVGKPDAIGANHLGKLDEPPKKIKSFVE